jgi:hypothetical protein
MSLEPKRKYLSKQALTNKYSAFKSYYGNYFYRKKKVGSSGTWNTGPLGSQSYHSATEARI